MKIFFLFTIFLFVSKAFSGATSPYLLSPFPAEEMDRVINLEELPYPLLRQAALRAKHFGELNSTVELLKHMKLLSPVDPIFNNGIFVTRSAGFRGNVSMGGALDPDLLSLLREQGPLSLGDPASLIEPRIITFTQDDDAEFVNSRNVSLAFPRENHFFEMHVWNSITFNRDFYLGYISNNQVKLVKNPRVCFGCHEGGKPIWGGHVWPIHGLYAWSTERPGLTEGFEGVFRQREFEGAYGRFLEASGERSIWKFFNKHKFADTHTSLANELHLVYGAQETKRRFQALKKLPEYKNPRFQASVLMALLSLPSRFGAHHPLANIISSLRLSRQFGGGWDSSAVTI